MLTRQLLCGFTYTQVIGRKGVMSIAICYLPTQLLVAYRRAVSWVPCLFLMFINDLPNCLRDTAPRMFADDTNITLSAKMVADLKLAVISELINLTCWLRTNIVSLNVAKTELMITGLGRDWMPNVTRLILALMTRRSRGYIILNLWFLPLMPNSLGVNTLMRYARKPLQQLVH